MRSIAILIAFSTAAFVAPQQVAGPSELAGRTGGSPHRCILIQSGETLRVSGSDRHIILYGNGRTIWVTRVAPACAIGVNDILVTDPIGPYYCRGDLVRSYDRINRTPGAACKLGEFVPYTR